MVEASWGGRTQMSPVVELRSSRGVLALARSGVASGVVEWLTLSDLEASGLCYRSLDPPVAIDLRILCASPGQPPIALERASRALAQTISERIPFEDNLTCH